MRLAHIVFQLIESTMISSGHFSNLLKDSSINIPVITLSLIEKYVSDLRL